ncbi:MAG: electron transfer flavoprotein beta subunit/FixA family protein, partial [Oscillospiraceae bacterium]
MPNTVACFKWVRDSQDIVIRSDLTIDMSRAGGKISEYDRNVINAASTLSKAMEGKALGVTFGDETLKPALKDALSRGLD